jgi:F0F1-type ATP synthase assembly protein I
LDKDPRDRKRLGAYYRYSAAGLQLAVAGGLGLWFGWWLDGKAGTSPLLLILGMFLGFGAGIYSLYKDLFGRES